MSQRKLTTAVSAALALTLSATLSACGEAGGGESSPGGADTVTVGVVEMLTGSGAFYGQAVLEGLKVAQHEINAAGGVLGKRLELKVEDNASDNAQSTTLVRRFAADSAVPVVIPPTYQPNFNAACAAANSDGIPAVSAQSGPPEAKNNGKGFCYTMTTDPLAQVEATLRHLKEKGMTNLVMVYDQDNGYVAFQRPNIAKVVKEGGYTLTEIGVAKGTTDYGPQISKVIEARPDAVFPFFTIEDAARFMQQARAKGLDAPFFDPVSQLTSQRLIELSGGAAEGLIASTPQSSGDVPSFKAFLDSYESLNGKRLDDPTYTGFGYDALKLVAKAMTDAGTTTDRAKIKAAIDAQTSPCLSICFDNAGGGAFLANRFFFVRLTGSGFVPADS